METTQIGANGRPVRIPVGLDSCFAVELAPIPLQPTVDLTAQDWGDQYRVHSVILWIVQVRRDDQDSLLLVIIFSAWPEMFKGWNPVDSAIRHLSNQGPVRRIVPFWTTFLHLLCLPFYHKCRPSHIIICRWSLSTFPAANIVSFLAERKLCLSLQLMVTTHIGRTGPLVLRPVARGPQQGLAPAPTRLRSMVAGTVLN